MDWRDDKTAGQRTVPWRILAREANQTVDGRVPSWGAHGRRIRPPEPTGRRQGEPDRPSGPRTSATASARLGAPRAPGSKPSEPSIGPRELQSICFTKWLPQTDIRATLVTVETFRYVQLRRPMQSVTTHEADRKG